MTDTPVRGQQSEGKGRDKSARLALGSTAQCWQLLEDRDVKVIQLASTTEKPKLSVVIPTYNTEQWIGDAIRSVLAQTEQAIEVIVVDDGSTDDGLTRAKAWDDPRLTILSQPNQGLSAARNTGILAARAEMIGFLDSDDIWYPQKAEKHLALHAKDLKVGLSFSWSAYLDRDGKETGQLLVSRKTHPSARDLTERNDIGNGSTAVVKRELFEQVGLFDEQLRSCEDLDMWVRIAAETSVALVLVPEFLTGYRVREGSLSLSFGTFLEAATVLRKRFTSLVPGFTESDGNRCYAQLLRIASRKALADGQVAVSRRLLGSALQASHKLLFTDVRALALLAIHGCTFFLPERTAYASYRATTRFVGTAMSLLFKRPCRPLGVPRRSIQPGS